MVALEPPPPSFGELHNIPYVCENPSKYQQLDIYFPTVTPGAPAPLVVFIHGGGWYEGDKANPPGLWLRDKGFAVASVNYRLTDEAPWPAQIKDVKAAIQFLRANAKNYNIDPDHIGVWGMSAGGHLAALVGTSGGITALNPINESTQSDRVQAVVDWFGPADFTLVGADGPVTPNVANILDRFFGPASKERKAAEVAASPVSYVSSDDPPFLLMHGDRDRLVPLIQSESLYKALQKAGVPAELVVVHGAGHQMFERQYVQQVGDFFDKTLVKRDVAKTETQSPPATQSQMQ